MPFGLKNAPSTFQRAMDIILAPAKWPFAIVYLDNIIIFSKTLEEHFEHIQVVMKLCQAAGLSLKLRKCFFFQNKVDYLGHVVSPGKLAVSTKTCEDIKGQRIPSSITEIRAFLGLCNVYRRFVKDFARIASPLKERLKKKNMGGLPFQAFRREGDRGIRSPQNGALVRTGLGTSKGRTAVRARYRRMRRINRRGTQPGP